MVTYHSAYSSRFLYTESLDHLEHIHHSLCLTPLNGGGYGTEHPRPAHCITGHRRETHVTINIAILGVNLQCNRFVASSDLNFNDVIDNISDGLDTGAAPVWGPVQYVELIHLLYFIGLHRGSQGECIELPGSTLTDKQLGKISFSLGIPISSVSVVSIRCLCRYVPCC